MGQTANQIETHIDTKRADLSSNLQELEDRVKSATDWRQQFQSRTAAFLGVAFGGGILLGAITSSGRRHRRCE